MKTRIFILLFSLCTSTVFARHPLHVSVVNLEVDHDSINFSVRLFYNDFENLINYKYNAFLDFKKDTRLVTKQQDAIQDYINSALIVKGNNGKKIVPKFLGWKVEDFSVWLYFKAPPLKGVTSITIQNKLMLEMFEDQKNLMILSLYGKEKGVEFNKRTTVQHFSLN